MDDERDCSVLEETINARLMSPLVLIPLALVALTGCGGGKPIKAEDRAGITSVSVATPVKVPDEPLMVGSEAGLSIPHWQGGCRGLGNDSSFQRSSDLYRRRDEGESSGTQKGV